MQSFWIFTSKQIKAHRILICQKMRDACSEIRNDFEAATASSVVLSVLYSCRKLPKV